MRVLKLFFFGILFSGSVCAYTQQFDPATQRSIDSLSQLTQASQQEEVRANAFIQLSLILYIADFDTLLAMNSAARDIAFAKLRTNPDDSTRFRFLKIASEASNNIGYYYQETGDFETAQKYYQYCLETDQQTGNWPGISTTLNNLGMICNYQGDVFKALDFFLGSLKIDEALDEGADLGPSLNNIAYLYEHQQDTARALYYYKRALHEFRQSGDTYSEATVLINLGSVFRKQQLTQLADSCFRQSIFLSQQLGSSDLEAAGLLNLGFLFFEDSLVDSSRHVLARALILKKEAGDLNGESIILVNQGKCDLAQNKINEALQQGERAMQLATQTGHVYNQKSAAELLANVYEKKGQFENALLMHKRFITLRDSLENSKTKQYTFQKGMYYEYEKKQALKDAEHQQEIALGDLKQRNQQLVMILTGCILLLIVIFALILLGRYKKMRAQKQLIERKNAENELLLGEIHHRVKNNLQVIASLLSLQEKNLDDSMAKKAILEGRERVNSISLIHKLLYQQDRFSGVEMSSYIQKLLDGLIKTFGKESTNLALEIQAQPIHLDVDSAVPIGLIINELVINAFKYAYEETASPVLKIKLEKHPDFLFLQVQDNGTGDAEQVFQSDSFGLKLVRSLVRQVSGDITVESTDGLRYTVRIHDFKEVLA